MPKHTFNHKAKLDRQVSMPLISNTGHIVAHAKTDADGVLYLYRSLNGSRHFLRYPLAIAFDVLVIEQAEAHGCQYALVLDRDSNHSYKASLDALKTYGFRVSRGHGPQIALKFDHWEESDPTGRPLKPTNAQGKREAA